MEGLLVVSLDENGFVVIPDGPHVIFQVILRKSPVVVGFSKCGFEVDDFAEVADGPLVIFHLAAHQPPVVIGLSHR